jgi:hypothetical protein
MFRRPILRVRLMNLPLKTMLKRKSQKVMLKKRRRNHLRKVHEYDLN